MSKVLFVQYPKCSTCQKASKYLSNSKIAVESRDITTDNPTKEELATWLKKSGLPVNKFFNTAGKLYRDNNLKEKVTIASQDELLTILASSGMLVKRPILVADDFVLVGFDEKEWGSKLKQSSDF